MKLPRNLNHVIVFCLFLFYSMCALPVQAKVPGKTNAVLKINSLDSLTTNWQTFLTNASDVEFNIQLEQYITKGFALKSLQGVNRSQALWAVYSEFSSGDEPVAAFYPIQDETLFRKQLPDDRLTVTMHNEYALISDQGHAVELHEWHKNGGSLENLQEILPSNENEIQLWGNLENLFDDYKKFLRENLFDNLQLPENNQSPWSLALQKTIFDLSAQVESLEIQINISPEQIQIQKIAYPKPDSSLHTFAKSFQPTEASIATSLYVPESLAFGLLNTNANHAQAVLQPFWDSLNTFEIGSLRQTAEEAANGSLAVSLELSNNLNDPIRLHAAQHAVGEAKGEAFLEAWQRAVKNIAEANGLGNKVQLGPNNEQFKDREVRSVTFSFKPGDPEAETPDTLWGEELTLHQLAIDQTILNTNDRIRDLYTRIQRNHKKQSSEEWPSEQDKQALFAGRLNLIEALRAAQMYLAKLSTGFNPLLVVKIPDVETRGITARADFQEENLVGTIQIRAEEINTLIKVITNQYPIDTKARNSKGRNQ